MGPLRVGHDWATSLSLFCIGEGNGNTLQCSCLENPRDGGAWWAAVYGVTQSRTRLKRLSSSTVNGGEIPSNPTSPFNPIMCAVLCSVSSAVSTLSHPTLFYLMDCVAHLAPLSMGFSRQDYWSRLPCPPPGDLPDPRIEPGSPALQADSLPLASPGKQLLHGYSLITQTLGSILNSEYSRSHI